MLLFSTTPHICNHAIGSSWQLHTFTERSNTQQNVTHLIQICYKCKCFGRHCFVHLHASSNSIRFPLCFVRSYLQLSHITSFCSSLTKLFCRNRPTSARQSRQHQSVLPEFIFQPLATSKHASGNLKACSRPHKSMLPDTAKRTPVDTKACSWAHQSVLPGFLFQLLATSKTLPGTSTRAPGHTKPCCRHG